MNHRIKYLLSLFLLLAVFVLFAPSTMAFKPITVYLNEQTLQFDVDPIIENGKTLVPMRKIFESLGADVSYDGNTQTVYASKKAKKVIIPIGSKYPIINGEATVIDVPAKVVNGRTLVPLRFVSETLGAEVNWNHQSRTITINDSNNHTGFHVIRIY